MTEVTEEFSRLVLAAGLIDGMRLFAMDRRDKRPLVDPKAFELAEHFLSDFEGDEAGEDQKWQLAKVIQDAVEGWFEHG